jgi:hypothetical protein
MRITGRELNLAEDTFKLGHLLDCKLLRTREVFHMFLHRMCISDGLKGACVAESYLKYWYLCTVMLFSFWVNVWLS